MTLAETIESLLFEDESPTLDFKRDQYPFAAASDEEKSELLKDILAFANAWRRTDAYVLIGVAGRAGSPAEIVGVQDHLEDASLQQFVNSKTQRPLEFSYKTAAIQGKSVGVIHIPVQRRPFHLKRDYGKLKKETVYLRRGSSTGIATIDEIAQMGTTVSSGSLAEPKLSAFILHGEHREIEEKEVAFTVCDPECPPSNRIPEYGASGPYGISLNFNVNKDYYRDRLTYLVEHATKRPFGISVRNDGNAIARDVKLVFEVPSNNGTILLANQDELPQSPRKDRFMLPGEFGRSDISVTKTANGWHVVAHLGKIQAKDTKRSTGRFWLGATSQQGITIDAKIFCDDLSGPVSDQFKATIAVEKSKITLSMLDGAG